MRKLSYIGQHGIRAVCGIEIKIERGVPRVVFTELPENTGSSVANSIATLATRLYRERLNQYDPAEIQWFCHYPTRKLWSGDGSFSLAFSLHWNAKEQCFDEPSWHPMKVPPAQLAANHEVYA